MPNNLLRRICRLEDTQQARQGRVHVLKVASGQNPGEAKRKYHEENEVREEDLVIVVSFVGRRQEGEAAATPIE